MWCKTPFTRAQVSEHVRAFWELAKDMMPCLVDAGGFVYENEGQHDTYGGWWLLPLQRDRSASMNAASVIRECVNARVGYAFLSPPFFVDAKRDLNPYNVEAIFMMFQPKDMVARHGQDLASMFGEDVYGKKSIDRSML
jgi:hypothetical protein